MRLRSTDLLIVFATVDAAISALVMQLASHPAVAGTIVAGTFSFLLAYVAVRTDALKMAALWGLLLLDVLLPQFVLIADRPHDATHDGILLTEAAADRLVRGLDPYAHDYVDSIARSFFIPEVPVNFGLGHYVYMPATILLDAPLRVLGGPGAEFSWMWLPGAAVLGAASLWLGWNATAARASFVAVALNPLMVFDLFVQLNDVFFLAPALAAFAAVWRRRPVLAGALFGLSLGIKQQAILVAPFLALLALQRLDAAGRVRAAAAASAVLAALVVPFLLWDPRAFVGSTAGFFYGSGVDAYPIRGFGLPGLLLAAGWIANRWDAYPALAVQAVVGLPLLALAARDLGRRWSWPRCWLWAGGLVLAVFLLGRVVAPNYLDLALIFFALALVSWLDDVRPAPAEVA